MSTSPNSNNYVAGRIIKRQYGVSDAALRKWANANMVGAVRCPGGKRLYNISDVRVLFGNTQTAGEPIPKAKIIYARVSSDKQRDDLQRQIVELRKHYPNHELIKDVASGINFSSRKGFLTLLERVHAGSIEEVVISHRDRLCRFAFDLVEWLFTKHSVKLVVLDQAESPSSDPANVQQELAEDLFSVINVFVARNNGLRAAENRRKRTNQAEQGQEETKKKRGRPPKGGEEGVGKAAEEGAKDRGRQVSEDPSLSD
jgi:putative resolvase